MQLIASGDVYVIVTNQADTVMQAQADTALGYPSVAHYNGDDALILVQGMDTIDIIGVAGVDPGSSWIVDSGSTANHTLVRKSTVNYGSTDWTVGSGEWDVYAQNTYSNLGLHSYTIAPRRLIRLRVTTNIVTARAFNTCSAWRCHRRSI